jgi:Holliday junction resolvase RusA-like endonuclease
VGETLLAAYHVSGRPRTKGSLKVITPRGQKPRLIEDHKHSKPWRQRMVRTMRDQDTERGITFMAPHAGPVEVRATFTFERHGVTAKQLTWPTVNGGVNAVGDLDKLLRNLLDALTDAAILADDSQVCAVTTRKVWGPEAGLDVVIYALAE